MSDALYTRIAALESENAQLKSRANPMNIKHALVSNPAGFYASLGLTPEEKMHLQRVNVAEVLGDQAPPEMRYLAAMGPQLAQTSQLTTLISDLSRRVDELVVAPKKAESTRESLKALIANKEEYPNLSAAVAANPSLLDARMKGRSGEAADIAKELEAEAKLFADTYGFKAAQPASANADNKEAQSNQSKPAPLAGAAIDVPPLSGNAPGVFVPGGEEDRRIQAELSRKYG